MCWWSKNLAEVDWYLNCDFLSSYNNGKGGTHPSVVSFLNTIVFELLDYEMHKKRDKDILING